MKTTATTVTFAPSDDQHILKLEILADAIARASRDGLKAQVVAVRRHRSASGLQHVVDLFVPVGTLSGAGRLINLAGAVRDVAYDTRRRGYVVRTSGDPAFHVVDLMMRHLEDYLLRTGDTALDAAKVTDWQAHVTLTDL